MIVMVVLGQRYHLPLWPTMDALTPSLAGPAIFFGVAHLSSGDAFAAPTSVPWAIELWGARRHPTQIYEIALALLVFLAVWRLRRTPSYPGFLFLSWLALAVASRLFLETFRGDSIIAFGILRAAQLHSLAILAAAMVGLHLRARAVLAEGALADQVKKTT